MTGEAGAAGPRVGPAVDAALNLKMGGICLIVGAVVFPYGGCFTAIPRPRKPKQR
jgi:hypothetical protein